MYAYLFFVHFVLFIMLRICSDLFLTNGIIYLNNSIISFLKKIKFNILLKISIFKAGKYKPYECNNKFKRIS